MPLINQTLPKNIPQPTIEHPFFGPAKYEYVFFFCNMRCALFVWIV